MLFMERVHRFGNRVYVSKSGLWVMGHVLPRHNNVLAVLRQPGNSPILIPGRNIVTDNGDLHYAQQIVSEGLTNAFGIVEMASAGTPGKAAIRSGFTAIGSTQKAHDATYPKRNDGDGDNTGAGVDVVTYLTSYTKADFTHAAITHGLITNTGPAAGEPILTGYAFGSSINKTGNDTLKVFVNHTVNGV